MRFFHALLFFTFLFLPQLLFSQRGKDLARTVTAAGTIVNEYTTLTANAAVNATTITVAASGLNTNGRFSAPLAPGDLVMIIQMQGATINGTLVGIAGVPNDASWGDVTLYNECGNYEFREVASVPNGTSITLTCGLSNAYTITGKVQVVRIPRHTALTVNNPGTITGQTWDGTTGGVVAIEILDSAKVNTAGGITATGIGFRGGAELDNTDYFGGGFFSSTDGGEGAEKGEGIAGYGTDYDPYGGRFCRAAAANAGGGGTAHNSGGGGGANGGVVASWNGGGNPDISTAAFITAWDLEGGTFSANTSSGGGRGGYSFSNANLNATTLAGAPGQAAWGGDSRRITGGLGGRPLNYTLGKLFLGGGGGAGDQNDGDGGPGGRGGGLVFMLSYGTIGGTGSIVANGSNGSNSNNAGPPISGYAGIDGAGGGGGGGTVILNSVGTISGISVSANGGNGGNQNFAGGALASPTYNPAYGPGGGGGGGHIAISNGAITRNTNAGNNGTTNSSGLTEFNPNGATRGGAGTNNASIASYNLASVNDTICAGQTGSLTATVTGTAPGTVTWYTTQFGSANAGTGLTLTTPPLAGTTTYYLGVCPGGSFRVPVSVIVNPAPTINSSGVLITNETCAGNDGSITGITTVGATTYTWNGVSSAGPTLTGATSGSYTLVASNSSGCSATAGPFVIGTAGGPTINSTSIVITPTTCGLNNGGISGITASGTGTLSYTWNGISSAVLDITNQPSGNYTLQVTDGTGCVSTAGPFSIAASGSPAINTTNIVITDATCGSTNGSITGIVVTGGTNPLTYLWNGVAGSGADTLNAGTGNYSLVVNDAAGCSASAGPFTINAVGGATINDASVIINPTTCGLNNGSITNISITGGTTPLTITYNAVVSASADVSGLAAGSYSLQVTDGSGCISNSGPYVINASGSPVVSATGTDATCFGFSDGSASASAVGGNGTITYQWTGGPANANYSNLVAGTYEVIATDIDGCDDTTTVTISEPPQIITSIAGTTLICNGQNTTLTASGGISYTWSTTETTAAITVSPIGNTTYTVIISDGTCTATDSVLVTVNSLPVAIITGDSSLCTGDNTILTASGGTSYAWSTTETTTSITVSPASSQPISVIATNNCGSDTTTMNITVNSPPTVNAGSDVTIALGSSTTLTASGGIAFSWTPSTALTCTNCQSTNASPTSTTTYTVTGTDVNGCFASDDVTVSVDVLFIIFIPDAFSPNGDGSNDLLFVRGAGIQELQFNLYDRWGQVVFTTTDLTIGWDGTFQGKALNEAVFIYTLEGKYMNGQSFSQKGNITLHR